jgi:hypothetical protein
VAGCALCWSRPSFWRARCRRRGHILRFGLITTPTDALIYLRRVTAAMGPRSLIREHGIAHPGSSRAYMARNIAALLVSCSGNADESAVARQRPRVLPMCCAPRRRPRPGAATAAPVPQPTNPPSAAATHTSDPTHTPSCLQGNQLLVYRRHRQGGAVHVPGRRLQREHQISKEGSCYADVNRRLHEHGQALVRTDACTRGPAAPPGCPRRPRPLPGGWPEPRPCSPAVRGGGGGGHVAAANVVPFTALHPPFVPCMAMFVEREF